jgi:hypothetical protein
MESAQKILEITKVQFRTETERRFVDDLILYLDYKIVEGKRIRIERKQLSFWWATSYSDFKPKCDLMRLSGVRRLLPEVRNLTLGESMLDFNW